MPGAAAGAAAAAAAVSIVSINNVLHGRVLGLIVEAQSFVRRILDKCVAIEEATTIEEGEALAEVLDPLVSSAKKACESAVSLLGQHDDKDEDLLNRVLELTDVVNGATAKHTAVKNKIHRSQKLYMVVWLIEAMRKCINSKLLFELFNLSRHSY